VYRIIVMDSDGNLADYPAHAFVVVAIADTESWTRVERLAEVPARLRAHTAHAVRQLLVQLEMSPSGGDSLTFEEQER
jgi:hypothetical protein